MSPSSSSSTEEGWVYMWESQSQIPSLKLFLFNHLLNQPLSLYCLNLSIQLLPSTHQPHGTLLLSVSFYRGDRSGSSSSSSRRLDLTIPTPSAVLIDGDVPLNYRVLEDHIEVRLSLVLPVDHPVVCDLRRMLTNAVDDDDSFGHSDVKSLSSKGSVDFYCRNCSRKLTTQPICHFTEMPSVNWQEAADNWFGSCCCSFGGVSEKLVNKYSMSYACTKGKCLMNSSTVIVSKDDLFGFEFKDIQSGSQNENQLILDSDNDLNEVIPDFLCGQGAGISCHQLLNITPEMIDGRASTSDFLEVEMTENDEKPVCCHHERHSIWEQKTASHCNFESTKNNLRYCSIVKQVELLLNNRHFLNGFLGDVFMTGSYNLSSDVKWVDLACPKCSVLLGAYPSTDGCTPHDGGIRLIKCYISTYLPVGRAGDIFKNYTLERLFSSKILESAKDELSFRSIIRDLKTKSPSLQIVLLNPNCWLSTGHCSTSERTTGNTPNPVLKPSIKLLFDNCSNQESKSSLNVVRTKEELIAYSWSSIQLTEEWASRHQADEVHMLPQQIKELTEILASRKLDFPPSMACIQGSSLSYTWR